MPDIVYRTEVPAFPVERIAWGAIWIGVFTFVAIWSVFGLLGEAIFATAANPNAAEPIRGMSAAMGIWATIVTIIAMYIAGRVTAHYGNLADRTGRIIHGMAMFGLSVLSVIIMVILSGTALSGVTGADGAAHTPYMITVFSDVGWIGFACLFLGWLAAMGGAAHGPMRRAQGSTTSTPNVRDIRPAA
jgi:hypothetical protein